MDHEVIPVLTVQMPSNPSVRRFYSTMLDVLGAPIAYSTTAQYESIAIKLMKVTEVKILIIDELHNLLAGNNNVQREFLNVLRFIGNTMKIPIVGVGIKDAYLAIRSDDQLENRFEPFILPLWKNDNEFIKLLKSKYKETWLSRDRLNLFVITGIVRTAPGLICLLNDH